MGKENQNNKTEKKKVIKKKKVEKTPEEKIRKFEDLNQGIEVDTKNEKINLIDCDVVTIERKRHTSEKVAMIQIKNLTEVINRLRRTRALVKRLGFKTSEKDGKYV